VAEEKASSGFRLPRRSQDDWRGTVRSRLVVGAVVFGLWTAGIEARLLYLQVVQHAEMMARAARQRLNTIDVPARRGDILDRNGRVLAYSVDADTIFADPSEIDDPDRTAILVCGALDHCDAEIRLAMVRSLRRKGQFAPLARKVTPEEEHRVRALKLPGIGIMKESGRFYPKRELMSHVLGYVGTDNVGLAGLESTYDAQIRGRAGKVLIQRDARRDALTSHVERQATAGATLELTIDQYLQNIAERELQAGVLENRAASGAAVVMDPATGEILALANFPTFNPNAFGRAADGTKRNRAVQDLYEPGSTFKVVTASAALEENVLGPDDPIDVSAGLIRFGPRVIDDVHRYGVLSFTDVVVKSSNVGAIKIGLRLGPERLGRYVSRFGFGQPIAPDFPSESPGIVWNPAKLDPSALASVSMGYQVGVTPIQMAAAVSSIANGGTLYEPRVVRALIKDNQRVDVPHKVLRRTVSDHTAAELTAIMEAVVERGTAKAAQLEGYTIAGKTGTAHKLVDGRYSPSEYNASFVGFIPSRKPVLTIIVLIDSPHGGSHMGGAVAAPIFKRIAEHSLRHLGVAPTINPPPPVLVAGHEPDPDAIVARTVSAPLEISNVLAPARSGLMPDLRGLSARDAVRALTRIGMTARMNGDGFVLEQSPVPGTALIPGEVCALRLERRPSTSAPSGVPQ
jgi:cell division protein FtsI (penicillin-binding protein 3)